MRRVLISTKPFIFVLFLVGVTVRSAESLSSVIPLGTSTKRANSKRANHGRSRLFQDAVSSVSFWLRSFPVCGWRTRSLSSVSGLPTRWRCFRGWLMRLLWAYEHDSVAISPFLYERIGTICRQSCWSLCEQRIAGWRSGRSEGYCKSLSAGHAPTDLLLLTQRTSRLASRKYAFPPVSLLAQTLCKLREDEEQVLLVAPHWPTQTWFPELISLATAPPWRIPLRKELLSQGLGTIWHPRPDLWNLHVWLLDGTRQTWVVYHRQW